MEVFMDFGHARLYVHHTGFLLALVKHEEGSGKPFSELNTGLDHISFTVAREDLPRWEERFDEMDVAYTPTRDMEFGSHLNFRDPDNIPFEFFAPLPQVEVVLQAIVSGEMTAEGLAELARQQIADFEPS
jgi:catechol 2,3-dioxygenase-like lactoylglutathione lyase family enzyme